MRQQRQSGTLPSAHQVDLNGLLCTGSAAPIKSPSKAKAGKKSAGQKRPSTDPADGDEAVVAPAVARLRLLMQFIPALCSYDQASDANSLPSCS